MNHRTAGWIVVFAKAPRPGRVKTRLCPPLSPDQAADLYRCMLADVLAETARAASACALRPWLAAAPAEALDELVLRAPAGFGAFAQRGADLGARMDHVVRQAAAAGVERLLLRGSDSPLLELRAIRDAAQRLSVEDLCISPDPDGGYNLIGLSERALRRASAEKGLFHHEMSTPDVLEQTRRRAESFGLGVVVLEPTSDIDVYADLERLAEARERRRGALPCPGTLTFLDEHRLWP